MSWWASEQNVGWRVTVMTTRAPVVLTNWIFSHGLGPVRNLKPQDNADSKWNFYNLLHSCIWSLFHFRELLSQKIMINMLDQRLEKILNSLFIRTKNPPAKSQRTTIKYLYILWLTDCTQIHWKPSKSYSTVVHFFQFPETLSKR